MKRFYLKIGQDEHVNLTFPLEEHLIAVAQRQSA